MLAEVRKWRRYRHRHRSLEGVPEPGRIPAQATGEAEAVVRALAELPAEYEEILRAKYLDGQSVREIAEVLRISPKAVESQLTRARAAFRMAFPQLGLET